METKNIRPRVTQGHIKMRRYIDLLIRNDKFRKLLNRLNKSDEYITHDPEKWTTKEKKQHDNINTELRSIINEYEKLRKRCKKILWSKRFRNQELISSEYSLDEELIYLARKIESGNAEDVKIAELFAELDMCRTEDLYDEELNPGNPGEEIIHLRPNRQLRRIAYPIAISIHRKAAKRDVIDYIEKRWDWISSLLRLSKEDGILKFRKRKYSQELRDYIWNNRFLSVKEVKKLLDKDIPNNGLIYYEINKLKQIEKHKRLENLT